jgi:hypothetical protein
MDISCCDCSCGDCSNNDCSCNDCSCNGTIHYNAAGVFYVSLSNFRNVFQFKTNEISNNTLNSNSLHDTSSDMKYHVNNNLYPSINLVHAMMNDINSENAISTYSNEMIKNDFLRYITKEYFGTYNAMAFFRNSKDYLYHIEKVGWSQKIIFENILNGCYNSGIGLNNYVKISNNISRELLLVIDEFASERLDVSFNGIMDTSASQPVPFLEGDIINMVVKMQPNNNNPLINSLRNGVEIKSKYYLVKLILTNDSNKTNIIPSLTLSDISNNQGVTDDGVP